MAEPDLQPDNEFWRFSLTTYAAPGVQAACLDWQDRFGVDVNLALFCAWLGAARGVALGAGDLAEAAALMREWRDGVVAPLRAARRAMRPMREAPVAALRQRIVAAELEAEQVQQAMLFRLAEARWPAAAPARGVALRNLHLLLPSGAAGATAALLAEAAEAQVFQATAVCIQT